MTKVRHIRLRPAATIDVVVIGAGHAGLAVSHLLSEQAIEHVVLERGEVANTWRHERWDSLKLLTPNWQTQLPGYHYAGNDPDGFMGMSDVVQFIQNYAAFTRAPVRTNTRVTSVRRNQSGYSVATTRETWQAKCVVIASGACNIAQVPAIASNVPDNVSQLTPHQYHSPAQIQGGGVLVVGASASGMQLADELLKAGHAVTIAVGEHVRMPRSYRGKDIMFWMDRCGVLGERYDEVEDISRGRRLPSAQLVGSHGKRLLDLNSLTDQGARITGRLVGFNNGIAQFSGSLRNVCALADLKMARLLNTIDEQLTGVRDIPPPERFEDTRVEESPTLSVNLKNDAINTIIWATGFRPDYSWLDVPVLDRKGQLRHDGGVVESPGLYVLGLPLMRRRKSSFIFGIEDDARDISGHLTRYLKSNIRSDAHELYQHHSC
ncbi:MAG TPA: NAD(P)-binding domain-containing protein [Xanthomonadales bacterium]|nr:NAD(P)-binding domain-containing protein [Xanthomonadales bacterium]